MNQHQQDIAAAKAARRSTLKSLKAKRESRIKSIQEKAAEDIRQVNIMFAADPERLKAKYDADAAYKSERAKRRAAKAQARAEKRIAYEIQQKKEAHIYSFGEEVFNSITIGIGAGLSVAGLILFIIHAVTHADPAIFARTVVSYTLCGSYLFVLYLMSTLAHALPSYSAKHVFRVLSYDFGFAWISAVISLIGLVVIRGTLGWVLFGIIWVICTFAISFYSSMQTHPSARKIGMRICLLLAVAAIIFEVVRLYSYNVLSGKLILLAIVSFLIAELFHLMKKVRWTNSIFHLLAIIAVTFCFFGLYSML